MLVGGIYCAMLDLFCFLSLAFQSFPLNFERLYSNLRVMYALIPPAPSNDFFVKPHYTFAVPFDLQVTNPQVYCGHAV